MTILGMTADQIAAEVAAATTEEDRRVVISPILRVLSDGSAASYLYFSLSTAGACFEKIHITGDNFFISVFGSSF
jgi:hypothetical protein